MPDSYPPEFIALKNQIESHRRLSGYYLIKWANIGELRLSTPSSEVLLDQIFQLFDDRTWPSPEKRPIDQTWNDYAVDRATAGQHTIKALIAGPEFGHLGPTMSPSTAEQYFDRFDSMFPVPKQYYIGMGFGNPEYVFLHGVAIVAKDLAGLLWIVEGD